MSATYGTPQDIRVITDAPPHDRPSIYSRRRGEFVPCTRDHPDRYLPPCRNGRGDHAADERCGVVGCTESIRWLDPKPGLVPIWALFEA